MPCLILVLADYILLVRAGATARLPAHTDYYAQLASAFSHGQLSLRLTPDAALLSLSNPDDPAQRTGIPVPMDVSLYNGKYYLYFGPVPAIILMLWGTVVPETIGDEYLVLLFVSGIFSCMALLIVRLWRRFFAGTSPWLLALSLLCAGLIAPFTSVAGRPNVYSAAIAGGQFFFLAGFFFAFDSLDREGVSRWRLAVAGILWGAALGCRVTLIVPIGFMVVMLVVAIMAKPGRLQVRSQAAVDLLMLGVALGMSLVILGWYNWARFGSALETGIKYQLAGPDLQAHTSDVFSPAYAIQNLYNYAANPPATTSRFPYIYSATGKMKPVSQHFPLPDFYHAERVTGLIYTGAFLALAIVPAIALLLFKSKGLELTSEQRLLRWTIISLYGCTLFGATSFILFFWAAERYLMDFLPGLVLLSMIGFWQVQKYLRNRRIGRRLFVAAAIALIVSSIVLSNLLALGSASLQY